ncbi:hypothetical protein [Bartonella massiliensis]|uniref:hypothetical protein n=1 Tax=Bartonella massiliensis TaxID=929795 RepID=UPI00163D0541|nr:hypothetical protein [Bartonella massiliensis]
MFQNHFRQNHTEQNNGGKNTPASRYNQTLSPNPVCFHHNSAHPTRLIFTSQRTTTPESRPKAIPSFSHTPHPTTFAQGRCFPSQQTNTTVLETANKEQTTTPESRSKAIPSFTHTPHPTTFAQGRCFPSQQTNTAVLETANKAQTTTPESRSKAIPSFTHTPHPTTFAQGRCFPSQQTDINASILKALSESQTH